MERQATLYIPAEGKARMLGSAEGATKSVMQYHQRIDNMLVRWSAEPVPNSVEIGHGLYMEQVTKGELAELYANSLRKRGYRVEYDCAVPLGETEAHLKISLYANGNHGRVIDLRNYAEEIAAYLIQSSKSWMKPIDSVVTFYK